MKRRSGRWRHWRPLYWNSYTTPNWWWWMVLLRAGAWRALLQPLSSNPTVTPGCRKNIRILAEPRHLTYRPRQTLIHGCLLTIPARKPSSRPIHLMRRVVGAKPREISRIRAIYKGESCHLLPLNNSNMEAHLILIIFNRPLNITTYTMEMRVQPEIFGLNPLRPQACRHPHTLTIRVYIWQVNRQAWGKILRPWIK